MSKSFCIFRTNYLVNSKKVVILHQIVKFGQVGRNRNDRTQQHIRPGNDPKGV